MRRIILIAGGLLLASPAWADFESDVKICVEGKAQAQINACTRVLQADKFGPRARAIMYSNRGASYASLKRYRHALTDYSEALRLNPRDAHVYVNRGATYHSLKQYRRAIRDYDTAIALNPKLHQAHGNRGLAFEALGRKGLAIRDFRSAVRLRPGDIIGTAGMRRLGVSP